MAALIGNIIQKKNQQSTEIIIESDFIEENEKENEGSYQNQNSNTNNKLDVFSQMSQYAKFLDMSDSFTEIRNSTSPKKKERENDKITSLDSVLKKKPATSLKRTRDEADIVEAPKKETIKRFQTMDTYSYENMTITNYEEMYNDNANNLWETSEVPANYEKESGEESTADIIEKLKQKQTAPTAKKLRNYNPEKSTGSFNILVGLLVFENETKKKYASKKEIKQVLKKVKDDLGDLPISSWAPMTTLIKYELVTSFNFSDEEKFSLTDAGYKTATDCYTKTLEKKLAPEEESKTNAGSTQACTMNIENSNSGASMYDEINNLLNESKLEEVNNEITKESKVFASANIFDEDTMDSTKETEKREKSLFKSMYSRSNTIFEKNSIIISDEENEKTVNFTHFEKLSASKGKVVTEEIPKEVEEEPEVQNSGHIVRKSKYYFCPIY